jgi:hypothetical protein
MTHKSLQQFFKYLREEEEIDDARDSSLSCGKLFRVVLHPSRRPVSLLVVSRSRW